MDSAAKTPGGTARGGLLNRAREIWRRLRSLGRRWQPESDGHPTPGQLAAYHEDRLPPEKEEEIQEHFVECPECPDLMLDLDRFASKQMPVLVVDDLSDTRVDRAWFRLRRQLLADVAVPRFPRLRIPRPWLLWLERPAVSWTLVSLLLLCTAGLGVRVQLLTSELRQRGEPELNALFAQVPLPSVTRGESVEPREVQVPLDARKILLAFDAPEQEIDHADYRLEIRKAGDTDVWKRAGLRKTQEGHFSVELPRHFVNEGIYTIRVVGLDPGNEWLVQDYRVRFSYL